MEKCVGTRDLSGVWQRVSGGKMTMSTIHFALFLFVYGRKGCFCSVFWPAQPRVSMASCPWPTVTFSPVSSVFGFFTMPACWQVQRPSESLLVPPAQAVPELLVPAVLLGVGLWPKQMPALYQRDWPLGPWLAGPGHSPSFSVYPPLPSWQTRKSLVRESSSGPVMFC